MKLSRLLAVVLSIAASTSLGHAQVSVYAAPVYNVFGFAGGSYGNGSYKAATGGVLGGAFYTFSSQSRFKAGIDGRVMYSPGYKGGQAYTGALRVSFIPNENRLRPYLQVGGGVVSTQLSSPACTAMGYCIPYTYRVTSGVAQLVFGLDIRVTDHLDMRAIDYGADAGGGSSGNVHAGTGFLDAGVIYHFHHTKHS